MDRVAGSGTLMWVSVVSGATAPHSTAAVWWLAYEPSGAIISAPRARCSTVTGSPAGRYTPWKSRWNLGPHNCLSV